MSDKRNGFHSGVRTDQRCSMAYAALVLFLNQAELEDDINRLKGRFRIQRDDSKITESAKKLILSMLDSFTALNIENTDEINPTCQITEALLELCNFITPLDIAPTSQPHSRAI